MHQVLIERNGDEVETVPAETSTEVALADGDDKVNRENTTCLSGKDLPLTSLLSM
jgi:hypothetical protein